MFCIVQLVCCFVDDEYDEDMLCALLETDDRQFDEGCKINEKWIVTCFMYTRVYILYIIRHLCYYDLTSFSPYADILLHILTPSLHSLNSVVQYW